MNEAILRTPLVFYDEQIASSIIIYKDGREHVHNVKIFTDKGL